MRFLHMIILLMATLTLMCCESKGPKDYTELKNSILSERDSLAAAYQKADSTVRKHLIVKSRAYLLEQFSNQIFPTWYNTPWDFYGMTEIPGEGKIACGYFVTTTLRDAGFNIPKNKWAQLASETFMKAFGSPQGLKRFRKTELKKVEEYIRKEGEGLYLVGLDCHVGYILYAQSNLSFIHSSYYHPATGVMKEDIYGRNPLNDSVYRVVMKLFDDGMVRRWLQGHKYS